MENNKYGLCMKQVSPKILADLNRKIFELGSALDPVKSLDSEVALRLNAVDSGKFDPNNFVLLDATAAVLGDHFDEGYLGVEMIMKGLEATPLYVSLNLPGSKSKNDGRVNKDFSDVHPYVKKVICDYWRSIADTLAFRGSGLSIEESKR